MRLNRQLQGVLFVVGWSGLVLRTRAGEWLSGADDAASFRLARLAPRWQHHDLCLRLSGCGDDRGTQAGSAKAPVFAQWPRVMVAEAAAKPRQPVQAHHQLAATRIAGGVRCAKYRPQPVP
jgi:hypothetical protein